MKYLKSRPNYTALDVELYEPHQDDPRELTIRCPVCVADVGEWCGGINDIHQERTNAIKA